MKKKIFSIITIVTFALIVAFNINTNLSNNVEQNLILANIEALAQGESGNTCTPIGTTEAWFGGCLYSCAICKEGFIYAVNLIHCTGK